MSDLQGVLEGLLSAYHRGDALVLLFDYDGTLVPIVEHPRLATLPPSTRHLLERLAGRPRVCLGIVSGRSVDDLKEMVSLPDIYYAGTSGLEVEVFGVRIVHPQVRPAERRMARVAERLRDLVAAFSGAWVEDKKLGLTVHYRGIAEEQIPALKAQVQSLLDSLAEPLRAVPGPMAVEITPELGWTKGTAARTILQHLGSERAAVVYAGDGANDVEAFQVVAASGGYAVGIGPDAPPVARYRLPDSAALVRFLGKLDDSLERGEPCSLRPSSNALALYGLWKHFLPTNLI